MNGPAMVAAHLDDRLDDLIASWRSALRRSGDVPRADSLTLEEFVDHVPALIDRMADRLRGRRVDVAPAAETHGHMRWRQGYDVSEVVAEYGHLRTTLVEATFAVAREQDFDLATLETAHTAIHKVLNEATAESVRQFQEDTDSQHRESLAELEERRRSIEEARRTAEVERSKLSALLESLPVGVWVADAEGRIIRLNREAEGLQQFPADATIGQVVVDKAATLYQLHRLDGAAYSPEEIPLARALRGEVVDREEMLWSQAEGMRVILASASPLRDTTGSIAGAVVVAQDITERKRLESELVSTTAQLKGIIEQSPVMIWRTGPDGRNDFVNRVYREFLGLSLRDVYAPDWAACIHPDDFTGVEETFRAALAARSAYSCDFRIRRHDGLYRWVASRGVPYSDDRGTFLGYLGTWLDITDQHELEVALKRQTEIAEESSQHKTRLMAALSHDARTPLNAVVLSAQLLEMHALDGDDPEVAECLRTIRNGVKNVLDLLGDLLDLTRIDAGAMPAEISRFPIMSAAAECFSSIETAARLKGLDCRFEPDGLVGLTIATDRAKFKQILANFLSNALRYTERGRIRLFGERAGDKICIGVEDTGAGIGPADQSRVFDEFATLENPRRMTGEGTGLGLAICRRLANLLGGEIRLQSRLGRGSTFTLVLPASTLTAEAEVESPATLSAGTGGGAILVAEDHDDSRHTLARVLRRLGYRVVEAADGREAVDLARAERPLAILMDVNMPVMDGIDATLALRADPMFLGLPIFALTGDVSVDNQRRIGEAGVQGYLEKPVTAEALKRALTTLEHPAA